MALGRAGRAIGGDKQAAAGPQLVEADVGPGCRHGREDGEDFGEGRGVEEDRVDVAGAAVCPSNARSQLGADIQSLMCTTNGVETR